MKIENGKWKIKTIKGSPSKRPRWGKHAGKKYGKYKICDERSYSYRVPGLIERIFLDWF
jgi:hypothetical protein